MLVYDRAERTCLSMNKMEVLREKLADIESAGASEVKEKFRELHGIECSRTNIRNLRKRIAYKLQEIYFGGISETDRAKLAAIADGDPMANLTIDGIKPRPLIKGTRLCRDWKGKTYEVIVLEDGKFEFNGDKYRSLSAIAGKITGTHWNGKKFFGVK